jgi:hypothetical protein
MPTTDHRDGYGTDARYRGDRVDRGQTNPISARTGFDVCEMFQAFTRNHVLNSHRSHLRCSTDALHASPVALGSTVDT